MSDEPKPDQEEPDMTTTTETPTEADELTVAEAEIVTPDISTIEGDAGVDDATARVDTAMEKWHAGDDTPERVELLPAMDRWAQMEAMAKRLAYAPTMPAHIKNSRDPEADMMVVLLAAHDLGLNATTALQKIHVIDGKPSMAAEMMRMLIRRDGHDIWSEVERDDDDKAVAVTWYGTRKDDPNQRVHEGRYTLTDATLAHLLGKDNWKKQPEDMLSARATSRLARKAFEDCLAGVSYTPEEITIVENEAPSATVAATSDAPLSEQHLEGLRATIGKLTDNEQEIVRRRWKELKLGGLIVGQAHTPVLRTSEMPVVVDLIAEARRDAVADAEIVTAHAFEGPEGATECATCGLAPDAEIHRETPQDRPETEIDGEGDDQAPTGEIDEESATGAEAPDPSGDDLVDQAAAVDEAARLKAVQQVHRLKDQQVADRLTSWRLAVPDGPAAARKRLVEAICARVICDECRALQTGPGRVDEKRCKCPF